MRNIRIVCKYVYQLIRHRLRNILYIRIDCLLIYELTCLACGQVGGEEVGAHREGPLLLLRLNQFNNTLYLSFNPSLTYSLFSLSFSIYLSLSLMLWCFCHKGICENFNAILRNKQREIHCKPKWMHNTKPLII